MKLTEHGVEVRRTQNEQSGFILLHRSLDVGHHPALSILLHFEGSVRMHLRGNLTILRQDTPVFGVIDVRVASSVLRLIGGTDANLGEVRLFC